MVYQHPLHYLLGLEGLALLRTFVGDFDRRFGDDRVAEIRRLLDEASFDTDGVESPTIDVADGYRVWSTSYDEPGNGLFPYEEPFVHGVIDSLAAGRALDAACGTGRHAEYLVQHGNEVIGVDSSADMLRRAADRVPTADLRLGDLHALPVPDGHVHLVVCGLALTHVADLAPVFAEFSRVLEPGGHLVLSDVHHATISLGSVPRVRTGEGDSAFLPAHRHLASDYLNAALRVGLEVRRCEETRPRPSTRGSVESVAAPPSSAGPWDDWPWSLLDIVPSASRAAFGTAPVTMLWHFQRPA